MLKTPTTDAPLDHTLLQTARSVRPNAHAPYSGFKVGAAVEISNGKIYTGINVENASYGLSMCAERTAIFKAVSESKNGKIKIAKIAVSCSADESSPPNFKMPCGACRQVIAEFSTSHTIILVDGVGEFLIEDLLPIPFKL